jgi:hypothetical protein
MPSSSCNMSPAQPREAFPHAGVKSSYGWIRTKWTIHEPPVHAGQRPRSTASFAGVMIGGMSGASGCAGWWRREQVLVGWVAGPAYGSTVGGPFIQQWHRSPSLVNTCSRVHAECCRLIVCFTLNSAPHVLDSRRINRTAFKLVRHVSLEYTAPSERHIPNRHTDCAGSSMPMPLLQCRDLAEELFLHTLTLHTSHTTTHNLTTFITAASPTLRIIHPSAR